MDRYVTIISRISVSELYVPMSLLESRGIECALKDSISNQVTPMYTIGDGGTKLQVKESDYELAFSILKEGGFIIEAQVRDSSLIKILDQQTLKIIGLQSLSLFLRLGILITFLLVLFMTIIYFLLL